ncbi:hypothetical protein [Poseidonibacter ostreae]|uniref:Uncharacterized protein n=1 Tax=Poseidonibacter ostreae TaxID=2654171 RepID=A0A6L4WWP9_9BACT|nr:hypothetical protein [Poseidonibacter ostreae]KAB7891287.1 hypothetical protein GBG19_00190 [Poseidonibacter ostreae]
MNAKKIISVVTVGSIIASSLFASSNRNIEIPKISNDMLSQIVGEDVSLTNDEKKSIDSFYGNGAKNNTVVKKVQISNSNITNIMNNDSKLSDLEKVQIKKYYGIEDVVIKNDNFTIDKRKNNEIKDKSYTSKFDEKKSSFTLVGLLNEIEAKQQLRSRNLHQHFSSSYIAKDTSMTINLSADEYDRVVKAYTIENALSLINNFTGLELSYKLNSVSADTKVLSVGVWTKYDKYNQVKYVTLEPKKQTSYLYGINANEKAFFYFKNYKTQYNKDVHFNLDIEELVDLYKKLIAWKIDKKFYNNTLAFQLSNAVSDKQNFNSNKVYQDLLTNPTIATLDEINEIYDTSSANDKPRTYITVRNNNTLKEIVDMLNKNNEVNYIDIDSIKLDNLTISTPENIIVRSFSDLEKFTFLDKKTLLNYRVKTLNNKYLIDSDKDFILYADKNNAKQEALRFLESSLSSARKIKNTNFTYDVFEQDIESLKRELR